MSERKAGGARKVVLMFHLECSKQFRRKERMTLPRGLSEDRKHDDFLEPWARRMHPDCTGNLAYWWTYARG